jgi:catechol 2,3-dioxygenase-like lactoylglutathione lyase family enzyme
VGVRFACSQRNEAKEALMSTQMGREQIQPRKAGMVDMKLEVIVLPVSHVDRAKSFYQGLGWRLDADFAPAADFRVVQLTPPHSRCSIIFGKGVTSAVPGSVQELMLIVDDIGAARADLIARGVDVSEVFHDVGGVFVHAGTKGRVPGPDPAGRSYSSWASFRDPDGNGLLLQEIKERLPGRLWPKQTDGGNFEDVAALTRLLEETEEHHGQYEKTAPKHHWSHWYAAYVIARDHGRTPDEAAEDAKVHMKHMQGAS